MKKIFKQIAVAVMAVIIMTGCEDVATNVKMPPAEKKIVVQCFISPDDSVVSAMVTWSKPVIGTKYSAEPEYINNANVVISDGALSATLLWDADKQIYVSLIFNIQAGKKYYLSVSLPDGKSVSANCIVPFTQNKTLKFIEADTTFSDFGGEMVTCKFKYSDHESSSDNYFRLDGKPVLADPYDDYYVSGEFRQDSDLQAENAFEFMFYNDQFQAIDKVRAWLINCDYNYYQYHKTLQGAQNNFGLFTEPSIVYTNIEGGLGCFGAYNSFQLEVEL